ncbi:MAG: zf-HC2 domain-containing protein [Gemmatimonadota bacterium]|jgi:anti-sigma factor RsiW
MTCAELVRYLSDYIDHDLDEALRADARQHLATCDNCHAVLRTTKRTIELLRTVGSRPMPPERRRAVLARIRDSLPR